MRAGRPRSRGDPFPAPRAGETTPYRFAALRLLLILSRNAAFALLRLALKGGSDSADALGEAEPCQRQPSSLPFPSE